MRRRPSTKVSTISEPTDCRPRQDSVSKVALTAPSRICTPIRKRRRSRMSDSAPAGIADGIFGVGSQRCVKELRIARGPAVTG
jgi:hypothetical protein